MKSGKGYGLTELIVAAAIICAVLAVAFAGLLGSNRSWRTGRNKLVCRQEARKIIDNLARTLRGSSPEWSLGGSTYGISVSESGSRIDFYVPQMENGEIASLIKVTYKLDEEHPGRLLVKRGVEAAAVVSDSVESINFGGGCSGCSSHTCGTVAQNCPSVKVALTAADSGEEFSISTQIAVRNYEQSLSSEVVVEEPEAGEF
ncbi:MAG: hypothetical protein GX598_03565 [Elusimicrobia bacterium]|nr:hypothetical protein [Elusimicrobiota bacterium]